MRGAGHLERRPDRAGQRRHGPGVVEARQRQGGHGLGPRHDLERRFGEEAQRAMGAAFELHEVEARDVLHDPAARLHRLAEPVDEAQADDMVADGPGGEAAGPEALLATRPPTVGSPPVP